MKYLFAFFLLVSGISFAQNGDRTGNGGDFVRSSFITEAGRIIRVLSSTREGQDYCRRYEFSPETLKNVLDTSVIEVTDSRLYDHYGNEVDALGEPGKITLNISRWKELFSSGADLRVLIFHEVLRASDINDDNYIISQHLPMISVFDPFLVLRKEFNNAPITPYQNISRVFTNLTNKNLVWNCEFSEFKILDSITIRVLISSKTNRELQFFHVFTRMTVVDGINLRDSSVDRLEIPGLDRMKQVKAIFKFNQKYELLMNFDGLVFGKCRSL
jgi:hypothetical protein